MRYQIYIDSFLFLNLTLNCFVLFLMEQFADYRLRWRHRLAGAVLGTVVSCAFFFLPGVFGAGKVLVGQFGTGYVLTKFLMTKSGKSGKGEWRKEQSGTRRRRKFSQTYVYFWLSAFLLGGILVAWRNLLLLIAGREPGVLGEAAAGGFIAKILSWCIGRYRKGKEQSVFLVELWQDGRFVTLNGLLDSGNSLVEPLSGTPVCLMERKRFREFLPKEYRDGHPERFRVIPFCSVGKPHGLLNGFLVERVVVHGADGERSRENVFLADVPEGMSLEGRYEIILNRCFAQ